jgi:hypothetical protein
MALNFGKPDLNLIKPTGIGWYLMDSYGWIDLEELENTLAFMYAQVVGHDVNFPRLRKPRCDASAASRKVTQRHAKVRLVPWDSIR